MESQEASQALPSNFATIISDTRDKLKTEPTQSERETLLLQLAESESWEVVKTYIESKKQRLGELARTAAQESSNLSEIGLRFLVATLIADVLDDLVLEIEQPKIAKEYEYRSKQQWFFFNRG